VIVHYRVDGEDRTAEVTLRLIDRDDDHLSQFSEYEVRRDGELVGTVAGGAQTHWSSHRGRYVVGCRTWSAMPNGGMGEVDTRREALADMMRALDAL
jgi:hypothetical protein